MVVALLRQRGLGKTSGVTVEQEMATVFTVEAGLITRIVTYGDRSDALRDAGLRP